MQKAFWMLLKRLAVVSGFSIVLALANNNNVQTQERISGNLVVQGAKIGIFRHGTLVTKNAQGELVLAPSPSVATHTHPGVDLVANCGSPIHVIADGRVSDLIDSDKDRDFRSLGYMVLVEHEAPVNGKKTYSIYLHMKAPPKVAIGQKVKSGQSVIGEVGHTGAADGCHTHLEVRHFPSRYLEDAKWNQPWNIYGMDDQRNTERFRKNWEDPVAILSSDVKKEISRAESYYKTGNFQETINILENIRNQGISKNPEIDQLLSKAYIQYSYLQLNENKITPDEAIELNRKAYELDPMRPEASYNIACMYAKKGQVEEGIKWLEKSYPIITQEKYKQVLDAIKNDHDLNNLRLSPGFNYKFPKLALQTTQEASTQKPQESIEQNLLIAESADSNQKPLKLIGVDDKTGTRFSIIDKSGGLAGTDPCTGGYGPLEVIGEVPANISLENDAMVQALVERAKDIFVPKACPRFKIGGSEKLDLKLFKGKYTEKAEYVVSVQWTKYYPGEPMQREYQNKAYERAKLAADIGADIIRPLQTGKFLLLLGIDKEAGVKFWTLSYNRTDKCAYVGTGFKQEVFGEVPNNLSLLDDNLARSLIMKGAQNWLSECKKALERGKWSRFSLSIVLGPVGYETLNMAVFTRGTLTIFSPVLAAGETDIQGDQISLKNFTNHVLEAEKERIKIAQAKEREEKEQQEVRKRLKEFVDKNGVKEWVSLEKLSTNPFVYEGKTIGVVIRFYKMLSATQGVFGGRDFGLPAIVVSDIPKGLFTFEASVVLAGRVMGNIETQLPLLGKMMVPHLKFVGVHFCKNWSCSDILPTEKK